MSLRRTLAALPRDARDTLFLLVVIAWVIAPQALHLPAWAGALAALLLLWRGALAWQGRPLPGRWAVLPVVALAVGATLLTHRTLLGRDAGTTLIVVLLGLKTLEARARRDALVIFFLGFFTVLSNFFYSQSLATAAAMLIALLGLLTALVNAHMPVGRPPLALALRTAGTMALLGTPIMLALFLLFPRMAPLWGLPSDALTGRSGLSGQMEVGSIATLALDDSVALRVLFDTADNAAPPASQLYFRGPVLSRFDGRQWQAPAGRGGAAWPDPGSLPAHLHVRGAPLRYTVTLEPHQRPWLMVLDAAPERPDIAGMGAVMAPDLQWLATRPVTDVLRYSATSYPQFRHGPTRATPQLRALVELPAGFNPRTLALAQQLRADPAVARGGTPALVDAALTRLRTGGYQYTLDPGVYGEHTADEFWFDRKQGFCEHIASAFVVLMRAADVPARIVTGYQGGERNDVDGGWTVRQSDAHAWAEVWVEGRGWVRVDPTGAVAPDRVGQFRRLPAPRGAFGDAMGSVLSPGMAQRLRATWEAVNHAWNQWVLNYTQSRQLDLLKALGFGAPSWQDLARVLAGLVGALALAGALGALW
ncbi:transglutaminase, partial [Acidovorax sp. SRB_14]|uniref:transglutaminase family protein n=1 Tax=Acidovorax sp. SRB_14 TaxID=1962699 RepID=UPI0015633638|nr:transglutaminase [Acidovorax sp. SRB_14]